MFSVLAHEGLTGQQETEMIEYMQDMMGSGFLGSKFAGKASLMSSWFLGLHILFIFITWLAVIVFLVSLARYFWNKK